MSAANYNRNLAGQNALNAINESTRKFSSEADAAKAERNVTLGRLESLSGIATKDLSDKFRDYFNKVMTDTTSKFSTSLANYTPGLLSSSSYKGAMDQIGGQMKDYSTAVMKDMGTVNSALATAAEAASERVGDQASTYAKAASRATKTGLEDLMNISASNIGSLRDTTGAGIGVLSDTGQRGSERLYGTLATPIEAFQKIQGDQAFSNLYNPYFMRIASAPNVQRSDVGSMRDLYKYNV
jgi:hypothetical protein